MIVTINHTKPVDVRESFMVASSIDNQPLHLWPNDKPLLFRQEHDARLKIKQLAIADPGRKFVLLQFKGSCVAGESAWL